MVEYWYLEKKQWIYYPWQLLVALPFFESVRAWNPQSPVDELVDHIHIESYLIDHPVSSVLLSVKGDSMQDAWLQEGDVLVVDKALQAKWWDIVIAIVDNEYTVKYLEKTSDWRRYLKPWNSAYDDIYPEDSLEIFGVVTWSFRKY